MMNRKTISTQVSLFLVKYCPIEPLTIALFLIICIGLYFNIANPPSLILPSSLFFILHTLLSKHISYKFKARASECTRFFNLMKESFPEYDFNEDIHIREVCNQNHDFLYTEVIVHKESDYRVPIEHRLLQTEQVLPLHIFEKD